MISRPMLFNQIIEPQQEPLEDAQILELIHCVEERETEAFELGEKGEVSMKSRLCVPNLPDLKTQILLEGHQSLFISILVDI